MKKFLDKQHDQATVQEALTGNKGSAAMPADLQILIFFPAKTLLKKSPLKRELTNDMETIPQKNMSEGNCLQMINQNRTTKRRTLITIIRKNR